MLAKANKISVEEKWCGKRRFFPYISQSKLNTTKINLLK